MAKTSAADQAYTAALRAMRGAIKAQLTVLRFDEDRFHSLELIPTEMRDIPGLRLLDLSNTAITDLSPMQGMTGLDTLYLNQTAVSDLSPL